MHMTSLPDRAPHVTGTYKPPAVLNSPRERASWVAAITPRGAAALRCHPYGVWDAVEECVIPLTNPRRFDHPPSIDEPADWLRRVLLTVILNGKALKSSVVEYLVAMLAPGPRRFDGLPAYWLADANVNQTQAWAALSQRDGSAGRKVLTAVAADLQGHPLNHISAALLRLHDQEIQVPGEGGTTRQDGDPRAARRYRQGGRELLASLGAWPWTYAPKGRLPAGWHTSADYLDPLWAWHDAAVAELERECELARQAWEASEQEWEPSGRD
jgi:hypothetical protein